MRILGLFHKFRQSSCGWICTSHNETKVQSFQHVFVLTCPNLENLTLETITHDISETNGGSIILLLSLPIPTITNCICLLFCNEGITHSID